MGFTDKSGYWVPTPADEGSLGWLIPVILLLVGMPGLLAGAAFVNALSSGGTVAELRLLAVIAMALPVALLGLTRLRIAWILLLVVTPLLGTAGLALGSTLGLGAVVLGFGYWAAFAYLAVGGRANARYLRRVRGAVPRLGPAWRYTGPAAALSHPWARLSLWMAFSGALFAACAVVMVAWLILWFSVRGAATPSGLIIIILAILLYGITAYGLFRRRPYAYPLAFACFIFLATPARLGQEVMGGGSLWPIATLPLSILGCFWLAEGRGVNLALRHRYQVPTEDGG